MKPATTYYPAGHKGLRGIQLLENAFVDNCDAVRHCHGFHLVMGHINKGCPQALMQLGDFGTHGTCEVWHPGWKAVRRRGRLSVRERLLVQVLHAGVVRRKVGEVYG